jgi:hypothetical protein
MATSLVVSLVVVSTARTGGGCFVGVGTEGLLEQRVRDPATRGQLHRFFRSLPPERFPALVALGEHVWLDNRDERFTAAWTSLSTGWNTRAAPPTGRCPAGERSMTLTEVTHEHPRSLWVMQR